jgi:hypothetical protein
MYGKDIQKQVASASAARKEIIQMMGGLKKAVEAGMISESEFLPLNVCGTVSNVLCKIFLDNNPPKYRYQYENQKNEKGYITKLIALAGALNGRSRTKPYLLRVDCDGHSYTIYIRTAQDEGYLFQGNAAKSMKYFTLQDWVNSPKSQKVISIRKHLDLLFQIGKAKIIKGGPLKKKVVDTFSIDDDYKTAFEPFKASNFTFCFREVNEKIIKNNLFSLYKKTRIAIPSVFKN